MTTTYPPTIFGSELPSHCSPTSSFLYKVSVTLGVCLPTPLGFVSILLGSLSILSWLFAQLPQIYKNYQIKSTAGLSLLFLAEWLLGDLTNLLGALFTKQAGWQVVIASYYVFVDICLVVQYFWYTYLVPRWSDGSVHSSASSLNDDADSDMINSLSPINSNFADGPADYIKDGEDEVPQTPPMRPVHTQHFSNVNHEKSRLDPRMPSGNNEKLTTASLSGLSPRTVMYAATLSSLVAQATASPIVSFTDQPQHGVHQYQRETTLEIVGMILSWCSTVLYLGSRLPQLYKNWRRQSTAGLSPLLFMAAFSGNFFYSSSMLTNPNAWHDFGPYGGHGWADENGSKRAFWIANAAPFFFGAFGVLFMDGTMGLQFLMYGESEEKLVKVRRRHGVSRWEKVSGWMRGWIPSLRKERVVDTAESQRLLSESRDLDRHTRHSQYGGT